MFSKMRTKYTMNTYYNNRPDGYQESIRQGLHIPERALRNTSEILLPGLALRICIPAVSIHSRMKKHAGLRKGFR